MAQSEAKSVVAEDPTPVLPPKDSVPLSLVKMGEAPFYSRHAFLVDKSSRTLTVWEQDEKEKLPKFVAAYPTDMGKKDGDKHKLGDHRTPEGVYFLLDKYEGPSLNYEDYGVRAFTMDYPNFFDQRDNKTGNGIWLHAIPDNKSLKRGSRGCVVVRNEVIKKLSEFVNLKKTPIIVEDQVRWASPAQAKFEQDRVLTWLENWRKTWESKNIEDYIRYYADDFQWLNMNRDKYRQYKASLNEKYKYISVRVKSPVVYRHKSEWVVRFIQDYESDQLTDLGEKYLYLKEQPNGELKIVGEVWQSLANDLIAQQLKDQKVY